MTDWRGLKFHRRREIGFPLVRNTAMYRFVNGPDQSEMHDEESRGPRAWDGVRASRIRRARKLIEQPGYPPKETLAAVADLLARELTAKRRTPK